MLNEWNNWTIKWHLRLGQRFCQHLVGSDNLTITQPVLHLFFINSKKLACYRQMYVRILQINKKTSTEKEQQQKFTS